MSSLYFDIALFISKSVIRIEIMRSKCPLFYRSINKIVTFTLNVFVGRMHCSLRWPCSVESNTVQSAVFVAVCCTTCFKALLWRVRWEMHADQSPALLVFKWSISYSRGALHSGIIKMRIVIPYYVPSVQIRF